MGSTLTGSTVASTYTGLLKTSDTGAINSTLKTISDGSGNDSALQLSTTSVNIAAASGNFTIATDKLTVAGASGNTAVAGTLSATGNFAINTNKFNVTATTGNFSAAGNASITGSASVNGDISTNGRVVLNGNYGVNQNSASGSNSFAGPVTFSNTTTFSASPVFSTNVTFNNNVTINGTATLAGVSALNGNITLGDAAGDTITVNGTPTFNAAATFAGAATFTGAATFNGNVTIGSDATDTLSINAAFNPSTVTLASEDFFLIQDVSDSNKIKKVATSDVQTYKKFVSSEYNIPSSGPTVNTDNILTIPISSTGLGGTPDIVIPQLVCKIANNGYSVGDIINFDQCWSGDYAPVYGLSFSGANIVLNRMTWSGLWDGYGNTPGSLSYIRVDLNPTKWKARIVAIKYN